MDKVKEILKYIHWRLFDNGKHTYWGVVSEPKEWENNPMIMKMPKEIGDLWKRRKK